MRIASDQEKKTKAHCLFKILLDSLWKALEVSIEIILGSTSIEIILYQKGIKMEREEKYWLKLYSDIGHVLLM